MNRNKYGAPLDSNGYARSVVQDDLSRCYFCGRSDQKLDRHEIYHSDMGGVLREKSKRYGLWVMLCHDSCHQNGEYSAHRSKDVALMLKRKGQQKAMEHYGWTEQEFRDVFGKSYL